MPFANEHAARQTEPAQYKQMRRGHVKGFPAGLSVIFGVTKDGKSEIQSVRADSSKWSADDFAAWLKEHDMAATVEKATGDKKTAKLADVSAEEKRQALAAALKVRFPSPSGCCEVWVHDVYDAEVIFNSNGQLWSAPYTYKSGKIEIGEAVKVHAIYEPLTESEGHIFEAYTDGDGRLRIMLDAVLDANGDPPKTAQLFASGTTRTTKGPVLFDSEAGAAVMAVLSDRANGNLLPFDYEHGMLAEHRTAETGKAAAWFAPAVVDGALWATDIQWTPAADAALRNREFRFFSPAVDLDAKSRRVQRLINVALTNLPAMKGIRPLVASEDTQPQGATPTEQEPMALQLFKMLGAEDEAAAVVALTERDAAHKTLLAEHESLKIKLATTEAESTKLAARINEMEGAAKKAAHEALIVKLSEDGKLEPSLHDWARTISTEALSAFGEKKAASAAAPKQPAVGAVTLTDEDEEVIKLHALDRDKFIAARKTERRPAAR